ncbi:MAG TPA: MATE family efflux transporter [Vicinamibacteria bacterium]|nr:MATE family efflux transporter [Vicinamibacteria bacterium]
MGAGEAIGRWWRGPGGGRDVLALAYPLILSHITFTVQVFIDRLFLTWYSVEAVAGAVTGLFATWALVGLFLGTGEYLTAFIAQYLGLGRPWRVGPAVWQGIYFSVAAGVVLAVLHPLGAPLFALAGHEAVVQAHEVTYSRILMLGGMPIVLMATASTFFTGRGRTKVVLLVNTLVTGADVVLNYLWIFGHAGFPRAGVAGAALSTVLTQALGAALYLALIFRPVHRRAYGTGSGWRFEWPLFARLLRFGLPTGLQYSIEILAFALFMMIVGRIGTAELAASSLAFNLNMIVFFPMLGLGIAVSALVARYLGAEQPAVAERAVWSGFGMSLAYMALCGFAYFVFPRVMLAPYAIGADPATFDPVQDMAVVLLRFVALYSIFDMMNVMFAAGLRGAGDTRYPMMLTFTLAWAAMLVPAWIACTLLGAGVYVAWTAASAYVVLLGLLELRRFRLGHWRSLRIVEPGPREPDPAGAEAERA